MDFQLFLKKYNIPTTLALIMLPLVSIICLPLYIYNYGIMWHEPFLFISGWIISGLGITFGYHRLFAHRSFKAHKIIQFLAMLSGSMALQNSILKWCSDHRTHHKKLDTEEDPYSIIKGFFHAHIGWVIENKNAKIEGVNDLKRNPVVMFQEKNYWVISITLSFIVPLIIGFIYGRPFGSLLWGGILRVTVVHHFTFFINSLCHFIGKSPMIP